MQPLQRVQLKDQSVHVQKLNLSHYVNFAFHEYFTYDGSLTTPSCNQGVKWILPMSFSYLTRKQVHKCFVKFVCTKFIVRYLYSFLADDS